MALITSCQATFQNFSGYEDDLASLEENIRECYSEITKTSEQINSSVREEFISRSELETIQKEFETSITQNSTEIRMDFTAITDEIKENVSANQLLLEEYIRFKGALIELGKVGNAFTAELSNEGLLKRTGRRLPISPTRAFRRCVFLFPKNGYREIDLSRGGDRPGRTGDI